jgi:hypothetical protein
VQWYYKAGLILGLIWAAARALGAAGEAQRDLDIGFLFGFMLTVGGWSAVFLIVDVVLRATGLRKVPRDTEPAPSSAATDPTTAAPHQKPPDATAKRRRP